MDADALAVRAEVAYARGVESLVQRTAEALLEARKQHALDLYDLAWGDAVGPDGKIASEDAKALHVHLSDRYAEAEADYAKVMTALAKARINLTDAAELRGALREYLTGEGVTRATVDAILGDLGRRIGADGLFGSSPEIPWASAGGGGR